MKIVRIITRHNIVNHGSVLQALATLKFFENLNYEASIINYVPNSESFLNLFSNQLKNNNNWNKSFLKKVLYTIIRYPSYIYGEIKFKKYKKKYLNISNKPLNEVTIKLQDFSNSLICAGSDQLWGPIADGTVDKTYFLDFTLGNNKFSFSSSVGRQENLSNDELDLLKKFRFVTVREESTARYLTKNGIKNCYNVLDPTLLIDKTCWKEISSTIKKKKKSDYILVYRLHNNPNFEKIVNELAKRKQMKVIRISNSFDSIFYYGHSKISIDPAYFLWLIENANFVLTDSFHCTVFSVIFEKNFYAISPGKTSKRIHDFLNILGLSSRLLNEEKCEKIDSNSINYIDVNFKLDIIVQENKRYIEKKLKEMEE